MFKIGDRVVYVSTDKSAPWHGHHGKVIGDFGGNLVTVEFDDRGVMFTVSITDLFEEADSAFVSTMQVNETKLKI